MLTSPWSCVPQLFYRLCCRYNSSVLCHRAIKYLIASDAVSQDSWTFIPHDYWRFGGLVGFVLCGFALHLIDSFPLNTSHDELLLYVFFLSTPSSASTFDLPPSYSNFRVPYSIPIYEEPLRLRTEEPSPF